MFAKWVGISMITNVIFESPLDGALGRQRGRERRCLGNHLPTRRGFVGRGGGEGDLLLIITLAGGKEVGLYTP